MAVGSIEHEFVPRHVIAGEREVQELLKKLGVTKDKLPKIKVEDPMAKDIGAQAGDVVKIIRDSPTAGRGYVVYRITIP
ncbi:MAG: DNA-directed RNA polymerase subunit H [Euryarchaeota archaeon]|nr:DNA-directed RNA polymerase subunit H [Euryarchaeota archaeon]